MKYLTEEEQYKEILNNEEINRIKDMELRELRMRYWKKRRDAFLDEHNMPDKELESMFDRLREEEQEEIKKYKIKHLNCK